MIFLQCNYWNDERRKYEKGNIYPTSFRIRVIRVAQVYQFSFVDPSPRQIEAIKKPLKCYLNDVLFTARETNGLGKTLLIFEFYNLTKQSAATSVRTLNFVFTLPKTT